MLTQILQIRRLGNQSRNLIVAIVLLSRLAVSTRKLLLHSAKYLQRTRVLDFLGFDVVGRGRNGQAMPAGGLERRSGIAVGGVCVAHDGLATFGGEVGFRWGGGVVETPSKKGIVYELSSTLEKYSTKAE
jgi:hypothetical protein